MSEPSITCPTCRRTSYSANDIAQRYCGYCHDFLPPEPSGRPGEYLTPGARCPACGHSFEMAVTQSGNAPQRGTLTVCLRCGDAAIYLGGDQYAPLTDELLAQVEAVKPTLILTLRAAQERVREHLRRASALSSG